MQTPLERLAFRRATSHDVGIFVEIATQVKSRTNMAETDPKKVFKILTDLSAITYILETRGEPVGLVLYRQFGLGRVYIEELWIAPSFQKRGYGSTALEFVFHNVERVNASIIELHTHPENPAQKLYTRYGFEVTKRIENFKDSGEPRLLMQKKLT